MLLQHHMLFSLSSQNDLWPRLEYRLLHKIAFPLFSQAFMRWRNWYSAMSECTSIKAVWTATFPYLWNLSISLHSSEYLNFKYKATFCLFWNIRNSYRFLFNFISLFKTAKIEKYLRVHSPLPLDNLLLATTTSKLRELNEKEIRKLAFGLALLLNIQSWKMQK